MTLLLSFTDQADSCTHLTVSGRRLLGDHTLAVGGGEAGPGGGEGGVSVGGGQHLGLAGPHGPLVQMLNIITRDCSLNSMIGWSIIQHRLSKQCKNRFTPD